MASDWLSYLRRHGFVRSGRAALGRIKMAMDPVRLKIESLVLRLLLLSHGLEAAAHSTLKRRLSTFQLVRGDATSAEALRETYERISDVGLMKSSGYDPSGLWTLANRLRIAHVPESLSERNDSFSNFRVNSVSGYLATGPRLDEVKAPDFPHTHYCFDLIRKFKMLDRGLTQKKLMELCDDSLVGNPFFIEYAGKRINHHLLRSFFYFSRVVENCELSQKPVILEIGAGFGGLGRIFKQWCPNSVYIILDIPETAIMSYYYLRRCFPNAEISVAKAGIAGLEQLDCDFVFLPHWAVETIPPDCVEVIINTASLGEMELEVSRNYIRQVLRMKPRYFYSVNHKVAIPKSLGTGELVGSTYSSDDYLGAMHAANWKVKIDKYAWIEDVAPAFGRDSGTMRYWEMLFENPDRREEERRNEGPGASPFSGSRSQSDLVRGVG